MATQSDKSQLLGEYIYQRDVFPDVEKYLEKFKSSEFYKLSGRRRYRLVNETLIQLIKNAPHQSFLYSSVIDYIDRVNRAEILDETWHFSSFEFWMNNFSGIPDEENYLLRGKIAGKFIPRDDYQAFFPIGMGKVFYGTHFVVAHLSPDVDTMIASFFGWMDAFAARVGTGQHLWSLPGGPPDSPVTTILKDFFGKNSFVITARVAGTLTLAAIDLVTQKNVLKENSKTSISTLDHGSNDKAVILVDDQGHFVGDWHTSDVELVRQIIILFKSCLRWFENNLHVKLITLFAKQNLKIGDIPPFLAQLFDVKIRECEPAQEFTEEQKRDLDLFFKEVTHLPKGLDSSFAELNQAFSELSVPELAELQNEVERLVDSSLFDAEGNLEEDRPKIFNRIEKIILELDKAILHARNYAEGLGVALDIKAKVLNHPPAYIALRSDVEDIRLKIKTHDYISVAIPEGGDKLFPVGVVWASDLRKTYLGTVSFRDFCNLDEVKMASYLTVISVVDHHKSILKTGSPPLAIIGDAQSCNVIVAEQSFLINDRQVKRKKMNNANGIHYIHPMREFSEYFCFLHAILDDTDLLTKVSARDVECVAQLLNRMKSITTGKETEIISLDLIPRNEQFAKEAAKQILHNPDMYSIYQKIYAYKETEIESSLKQCAQGMTTNIFSDTKEQNGCCRIGQLKMFTSNIPTFEALKPEILQVWLSKAQANNREHPEIDLHLFMISTIASSEEVYENSKGKYPHDDELWIWIAPTQSAATHLASFLSAFQNAPEVIKNHLKVSYLGENAKELEEIFIHNFLPVQKVESRVNLKTGSLAVLYYDAGSINSRKSMISPYLPRLLS